jgi:NADPH-dependent 2,4-dienoyl-CoA reductase/sulfur reductase-like enzyme/rhodanese-related sulfurtransferase
VGGQVKDMEDLMTTSSGYLRDTAFFEAVKDIKVNTGTLVESVEPDRKQIKVKKLPDGPSEAVPYDYLVLATGSSPVVPPIPGVDLKKVFTLRKPEDADTLLKLIEAGEADRVVIIGAGRIGLEVAEAFNAQAVETTMVEMADQILPGVADREMSDYISSVLREEKVDLRLSERVKELQGDGDGKVVKVITDKGEIETDAVLVAVGVKPNVELAEEAGLKLGETGCIAVDEYMRTSDPNIYAGGDCVECAHILSGKKVFAPLGSTANRQGRVIGDNLTGGEEKFPGITGASVLRTLGVSLARTGIGEKEAKELGYNPVAGLVPSVDKSHFIAGGRPILVKIIADRESGKVLGCQVVGQGDVVRQADVISTVIRYGGSLEDIADLDLCYAPPFGTPIGAAAHTANFVRNKINGLAETVSIYQMIEMIKSGDAVILDIRSPAEAESIKFGDEKTICIPQSELRSRMDGIPKDKEIVVVCQVAVRSYEAARALKGLGFDNVKFLEGGVSLWSKIAS